MKQYFQQVFLKKQDEIDAYIDINSSRADDLCPPV